MDWRQAGGPLNIAIGVLHQPDQVLSLPDRQLFQFGQFGKRLLISRHISQQTLQADYLG
ncbi:MAG TPA: hypothetical protein VIL31_02935 [Cyclobacteriaceae bacterium]|jgi:hypothetical protein